MSELKLRMLTVVVLLPVILAIIFVASNFVFVLFVALLGIVAYGEWLKLINKSMVIWTTVLYLGVLLIAIYQFGHLIEKTNYKLVLALFLPLMVLNLIGLCEFAIKGSIYWLKYLPLASINGLLIVLFVSLAIIGLRNSYGTATLFFVLLNIWAMDIFAYFVGRKLGKIKIAFKVSPGKSLEGLLAGLTGNFVVASVYAINVTWISFGSLLIMSIIIGLLSVFGDLYESSIKRKFGMKQSSNLLPGHGGVLDRIDGLIFAVPMVWILIGLFKA